MTSLDYMTSEGRRPSFGRVGGRDGGFTVTSLRSRPGAPQATPPQGLGPPPGAGSGTNAMSANSWLQTFVNTGPAIQQQAFRERRGSPVNGFGGMNQPVINEFMSQSQSAGSGMFSNPFSAPFRAWGMGGSPSPTATAMPTPTQGVDQDMASMTRDWLRSKAPVRPQWQSGTMAQPVSWQGAVAQSIPGLKRGDYAYATYGLQPWSRTFSKNG